MNELYKAVGISKQCFHQQMNRLLRKQEEYNYLVNIVYKLRSSHPTMGCRDIYYKVRPKHVGRDAFETFCKEEGLMSRPYRNKAKTTDSKGVKHFPNLTIDLDLHSINQLWVSDITYFEVSGKFDYLTFILDAFSRRIIGYSVSEDLKTESTTLMALNQAIRVRLKEGLKVFGTIFHSDGGGQYYDKEFLKLTKKYNFKNSMSEYAWENGKAERINGVIKNNYLIHREIRNYEELKKEVDRSVKLYNEEKPHISLGRKTPIEYEKLYICGRETSEAEQSTTEYKNYRSKGLSSPLGGRETSSASHITHEYKKQNI